jgi:hypothetical protein
MADTERFSQNDGDNMAYKLFNRPPTVRFSWMHKSSRRDIVLKFTAYDISGSNCCRVISSLFQSFGRALR